MNKYWFRKRRGLKSKDLGWGWIPISWEGWVTVVIMMVCIVFAGYIFEIYKDDVSLTNGLLFLATTVVIILLASLVSKSKTKPY